MPPGISPVRSFRQTAGWRCDFLWLSKMEQTQSTEPDNVKMATRVTPIYSYVLIGCLVAVFAAQVWTDGTGSLWLGSMNSSRIAGFYKSEVLRGEIWRFLTSAALHAGIIHLFFNSYALLILGRLIEMLSNRAHLAIIFVLSAVGGNILSLYFSASEVSVGASGGIIGFLGYLAVYGFYRRELLSSSFLKNMLLNIGFIALYGLALYQVIDNFAHLGGLLAGAIYGFLQIPRDLHTDPRDASSLTETIGLAALSIFIFTSVLSILLILRIVSFS